MRVLAILGILAAGCDAGTPPPAEVDAGLAGPDAPVDLPSIAGTPVASFETTSCSTGDVLPLSRQIAAEVDCINPGQLVVFEESATIAFVGAAVLPYLGLDARTDLYAAAAAGNGKVIEVTSAFRTVVQQYLLRRWFELKRCGITAAAAPGKSNHESGRALDISNYSAWVTTFGANGWAHDVPGDPVHFDHLASPDIRGADILAFQRLWNRNAPDEPINEDGSYGAMTEAAIQRAPAEGFGIGALCAARSLPQSSTDASGAASASENAVDSSTFPMCGS
ncbi:MAG: M15 family metallopeptidase [Proteobacteria bacterium]|nr:M15 family metallopeptidase [Pseudomonadota bacterium]